MNLKSFGYILRDFKKPELKLLILTVLISVLCVSSVLFLTEGIQSSLEDSSGVLLGGDRALVSPDPIPSVILDKAKSLNLKSSQTVLFYSMLMKKSEADQNKTQAATKNTVKDNVKATLEPELALAEVKAVDVNYPLKGELRASKNLFGEDEKQKEIPELGTVWLESNLFSLLNLEINDNIQIGYLPLKVTRVLTREPDRGGEGLSFAPRALMNIGDLAKTEVIGPGSRQQYKLLFKYETPIEQQNLTLFENWLKQNQNSNQKWVEAKEARPAIKSLLDQAEDYLIIILFLNLLIAALAISQAARRFTWQQYQMIAVLRCFGASFRWISTRFILEFVFYGLIITGIGYLLGGSLFYFSKWIFEDLLLISIPSPLQGGGWGSLLKPLLISTGVGLGLTCLFILPLLFKLKKVSPLWIFRERRDRVESEIQFSRFAGWRKVLTQWADQFGVEFRYGLGNLLRYPIENGIQILAFALVLSCALLVFLLRNDLLDTWHKQIPSHAPNYFAINIFPDAAPKFQTLLKSNSVQPERLYPIIRGRLLRINQEPLETPEGGYARGKTQLRRLLNLTYTKDLPQDNAVIEGEWFSEKDSGQALISIEQGFAERFGIHLNDHLTFQIEGQDFEVKVSSIRRVVWDTFHPNFFVIFPPKVLDELPFTYITSFYLQPEKQSFLRELLRTFPEINVIDMSLILKNIADLLLKTSFIIEYLWLITGIMAFLLLFCTLFVNLEERKNNAIIFLTLGLSRKKLIKIFLSEFVILGGIAGFIAIVISQGIYLYLGIKLFNLPVKVQPLWFLLGPMLGMFFISLVSYFGLRKIFKVSPKMALSSR